MFGFTTAASDAHAAIDELLDALGAMIHQVYHRRCDSISPYGGVELAHAGRSDDSPRIEIWHDGTSYRLELYTDADRTRCVLELQLDGVVDAINFVKSIR